jgi:5-methyltetrahydrofolate--homocysteine methyltransferase
MEDFRKALASPRLYIVDGGLGAMLQERGMPAGVSPELFCLENPAPLQAIHAEYIEAGASWISTNTFGGTRFKLGPDVDVTGLNRRMADLARRIAGERAWVAGSIGPTGHFLEPLGGVTFDEMVAAYKEQILGLVQGGADLILGETQFDLGEVKALVVAAREVCDLPLALSMTFEKGVSLTGTDPATFVDTMQNLGVDLIGVNCGAGPDEMLRVAESMATRATTPLLAYPNAGLPKLVDGRTVFDLSPEVFAEQTMRMAQAGVKFLGGCCGTTPAHIARLSALARGASFTPPSPREPECLVLTSRGASRIFSFQRPTVIIGERINPTGKKQLSAELQAGQFSQAMVYAQEQLDLGAGALDVNVGAPGVDEAAVLPALVKALTSRFPAPLALDSTNPEAVEAALKVYPGSPLVNSISGEPGRMERLGPLCKLHGAPFILLPLVGRELPVTAADRIRIIESLMQKALDLGVPKRLIMVDVLVLTVSSKPEAALHCFETIRYCRERLGLPTVCGLSNISFGLPARELLNSGFLGMGMASGLTACIANPSSTRLRETMAAAEVLLARDAQASRFIAGYGEWKPGSGGGPAGDGSGAPGKSQAKDLGEAVLVGDVENVAPLVAARLEAGDSAFSIVDATLIPAITEVGEKYERKEYYLPQLIRSAETMQRAFDLLKPLLEQDNQDTVRPVAIMATVEGDIHDIGKNIVCLMLRNHGFEVVDLGKDVSEERIIACASETKASLIGLSALMTTTMVKMESAIQAVRAAGLDAKVMVGGAVVTQQYADAISADGYAADAVAAVRLAKKLVQGDTSLTA